MGPLLAPKASYWFLGGKVWRQKGVGAQFLLILPTKLVYPEMLSKVFDLGIQRTRPSGMLLKSSYWRWSPRGIFKGGNEAAA
jgi:hypothetical protein